MNQVEELLKKLREIAKQSLIDKDWYNIDERDIDCQMHQLLDENNCGKEKV